MEHFFNNNNNNNNKLNLRQVSRSHYVSVSIKMKFWVSAEALSLSYFRPTEIMTPSLKLSGK